MALINIPTDDFPGIYPWSEGFSAGFDTTYYRDSHDRESVLHEASVIACAGCARTAAQLPPTVLDEYPTGVYCSDVSTGVLNLLSDLLPDLEPTGRTVEVGDKVVAEYIHGVEAYADTTQEGVAYV